MNLNVENLVAVKKNYLDIRSEINNFLENETKSENLTNEKIRRQLSLIVNNLGNLSTSYDWLIYEILLSKNVKSDEINVDSIGQFMAKKEKEESGN